MNTRRLDAVIFDLDGTLLDSLPLTFNAFREALRPFLGRDLTDQEIYARFGPADHVIVAGMVPRENSAEATRRLMAAYESGVDQVKVYPGVPEMLRSLRDSGLRVAVCTGRGRPSTELILTRLGIRTWFEEIVTGEEVPRPKPAPDGIQRTAALLTVPTERVLYAGDSVKDVEAGLAAGACTVAALWAGTEPDDPGFERAHARALSPGDVVKIASAVLR